jgi:cytidylate kinase
MIITIDGTAGSGKSSAAKALAKELGFYFLPTGKMYRAAAVLLLDAGLDPYAKVHDGTRIAELLKDCSFEISPKVVLLNGVDYATKLVSPAATAASSLFAEVPEMREELKREQRRIAALEKDIVSEGRDQGAWVFPSAPLKFFFDAPRNIRAERRKVQDPSRTLAEIELDLSTRDETDSQRECDPLKEPENAIHIDTGKYNEDEVQAILKKHYDACRSQPSPKPSSTAPCTGAISGH